MRAPTVLSLPQLNFSAYFGVLYELHYNTFCGDTFHVPFLQSVI